MNVVFDGENLLIKVNNGVTTLDIQTDIYSAWKEWIQQGDNAKFLPALRTIGGDPTVQEKTVAPYFFLMNGWKIKPASWTHALNLIGNLFVDAPETHGSNIVVPPDGSYTVLVNMSTTSDASKIISGSGVTLQDKQDIANLVEQQTGQPIKTKTDKIPDDPSKESTVFSMNEQIQEQLIDIVIQIMNIENVQTARMKLDGDIVTVYEYTNPDVIYAKYKLVKDAEGKIIERVPL